MHLCWDQVSDAPPWTGGCGQVGLSLKSWCFEAAKELVELSFLLRAECQLGSAWVVVVDSAVHRLAVLVGAIGFDGRGGVA